MLSFKKKKYILSMLNSKTQHMIQRKWTFLLSPIINLTLNKLIKLKLHVSQKIYWVSLISVYPLYIIIMSNCIILIKWSLLLYFSLTYFINIIITKQPLQKKCPITILVSIMNQVIERVTRTDSDISNSISQNSGYDHILGHEWFWRGSW